jgi:homocitrate synthase NifV
MKNTTSVWLIDSTLRDGEQAPGVVFSTKEKFQIASKLVAAGIDEIEIGIPVRGEDEQDTIRFLQREIQTVRLTNWCRAKSLDLDMAAACNTGSIHISFPASPILLKAFAKTEEWVIRQMERLIPLARKHFDYISVGAQDATRCDMRFLKQMVDLAGECGAQRFRIADTVGCASPMMISTIFTTLLETETRLMLEFHGHNDLGMATANTISAISSGAGAVSVTVNGLGERAGNACLEEIAAALPIALGIPSHINFHHLQDLCQLVAMITSRPIPKDKPITGSDVFTHESGIHCHALMKDQRSYQSFSPESVGRTPFRIQIGISSGTASLQHVLSKHGMDVDRETIDKMIPMVRKVALEKRRSLSTHELKMIWKYHSG